MEEVVVASEVGVEVVVGETPGEAEPAEVIDGRVTEIVH